MTKPPPRPRSHIRRGNFLLHPRDGCVGQHLLDVDRAVKADPLSVLFLESKGVAHALHHGLDRVDQIHPNLDQVIQDWQDGAVAVHQNLYMGGRFLDGLDLRPQAGLDELPEHPGRDQQRILCALIVGDSHHLHVWTHLLHIVAVHSVDDRRHLVQQRVGDLTVAHKVDKQLVIAAQLGGSLQDAGLDAVGSNNIVAVFAPPFGLLA